MPRFCFALSAFAALALPLAASANPPAAPPPSYTVVDLGTFGSAAPPSADATSSGLTADGQAFGLSPLYGPFLWRHGILTRLALGSPIGSAAFVYPAAVNTGSQVVLVAGALVNGSQSDDFHSYAWQDGTLTDLGTFSTDTSGRQSVSAAAVSPAGSVTGQAEVFDAQGNDKGSRAFLWRCGTLTNLGTLSRDANGAGYSNPLAVNDAGVVAGESTFYDPQGNDLGQKAVIWQNAVPTQIGSFGPIIGIAAESGAAVAVNRAGQVVGSTSQFDAQGNDKGMRAFLWQNGTLTNLGTLGLNPIGSGSSTAVAVNEAGQVAGTSEFYDEQGNSFGLRAFLWQNGTLTNLGTLGFGFSNDGNSQSQFLNNRGDVAGFFEAYDARYLPLGNHIFVWHAGTMTDIFTLVPDSANWSSAGITGFDDNGVLSVNATYGSPLLQHALLLRPSTAPLWTATGLSMAGGRTRLLWNKADGSASFWNVAATTNTYSPVFGPFGGWGAQAAAPAPDGGTRLLWTNTDGRAGVWKVASNGTIDYGATYGPVAGGWTAHMLAVGTDGGTRLLWARPDGAVSVWTLAANGTVTYSPVFGPFAGWHVRDLAAAPDNTLRLLWLNVSGAASVWTVKPGNVMSYSATLGPFDGWTAKGMSVFPDGSARLLWTHGDGRAWISTTNSKQNPSSGTLYGPYGGWTVQTLAISADGVLHPLWTHTDGRASFWNITTNGAVTYSPTFGPY